MIETTLHNAQSHIEIASQKAQRLIERLTGAGSNEKNPGTANPKGPVAHTAQTLEKEGEALNHRLDTLNNILFGENASTPCDGPGIPMAIGRAR